MKPIEAKYVCKIKNKSIFDTGIDIDEGGWSLFETFKKFINETIEINSIEYRLIGVDYQRCISWGQKRTIMLMVDEI